MKGNYRQRIGRLAIGIALVSCLAAKAFAATETTTFPVTATVVQGCTVSALPLVFGDYDPTSPTAKDATTTIEVACTIGTVFTTALDAGTTTGGTFTQRRMAGAVSGGTLGYNLYTDATRTTVWGDGTAGTGTVSGVGTGPLLVVPQIVYGRIPAQQNSQGDVYSDLITVTVTY